MDAVHERELGDDDRVGREGQDRHARAQRAEDSRRAAAAGVAGDGGDVGLGAGQGDGGIGERVGIGLGRGAAAGREVRGAASVALDRDPGRGLDRQHRVRADGRLGRQEDRVGAVEDRVGDVAGLGARRTRRDDHRLEHLGRDDRRHAEVERAPDELLLDDRHLLERQLNAEVAAGDHHRVGGPRDVVEVVDGGPRLDLGDDRQRGRAGERAQLADVVGASDEGLRQVVGAERRGARGATTVLLGQRRTREAVGRDAHAGVRADRAAAHDLGLHLGADRQDPQLGGSIREQDSVAGPQILAEGRVADVGAGGVARSLIARAQDEAVAGGQLDDRLDEVAEADLRAGQVDEHGGRRIGLANAADCEGVVVIGPVREVDARDVHAGRQELGNAVDGGGADGGHQLRPTPSEIAHARIVADARRMT